MGDNFNTDQPITESEEKLLTESLENKIIEFISENDVEIPKSISKDIETLFQENSFTSDEDDVVNIYGKNQLEDFESDTMLFRQVNVQVRGGNSSGDILDKYTYHGNLRTEGAVTTDVGLYDGEELINQLELTAPTAMNSLEDPEDWCIVLIEETIFEMGETQVIPRIYIYIPMRIASLEGEANDDVRKQ